MLLLFAFCLVASESVFACRSLTPHPSTPSHNRRHYGQVYAFATAGMRLLPEANQTKILGWISTLIEESDFMER